MEGNFSTSPPSPACPEPSGVTHIYAVTLWANHVTGEPSPSFGRSGGGAGGVNVMSYSQQGQCKYSKISFNYIK